MAIRILDSIADIPGETWNGFAGSGNPFVRHEFLSLLETTGCVGPGTGWTPNHLCLEEAGRPVGAAPLYLKHHSFGEFVFDWAWADAWHRTGRAYYPKLVCAAPFSPVTGPRLLTGPGAAPGVRGRLADALRDRTGATGASSVHVLFPTREDIRNLSEAGFLTRHDCQFQWFRRGLRDFDDFLDTLRSARRKKVRRERRKVAEQGIELETLHGGDIRDADWPALFRCYVSSYHIRGMTPYLNERFFRELARSALGDRLVVFAARRDHRIIAAAICLRDSEALFGRHWGALEEADSLHFETCYYQGIEYCLRHGLDRFEPGTQGEHKIHRGFEPVPTRSAHWIPDPDLREAVARFLARERRAVEAYAAAAADHLPYHRREPADPGR